MPPGTVAATAARLPAQAALQPMRPACDSQASPSITRVKTPHSELVGAVCTLSRAPRQHCEDYFCRARVRANCSSNPPLGPRAVRARRNAWSCVRSYDKVTRRKAALGRHVGQAPAGRHTRSHKVPGDTGHMPRLPPSRAPSHPPEPRTVCGLQVALHQVRSLGTSSSPAPTDVSNALAAGHRLSNPLNAAATRFQPSSCSYTR